MTNADRTTLEELKTLGVKTAAWTPEGRLMHVEFFPSEPPPPELPDPPQVTPFDTAYLQAAQLVRGVKPHGP